MRERVVLKWGGGLITEKSTMKTVRQDVLRDLAEQLEQCLLSGVDVVLVHGAGSFGHLKAKQYRLAEGRITGSAPMGPLTQDEAVEEVRADMLELNAHVMQVLTERDISAVSLPPHTWATNTGPAFEGDLAMFSQAPSGIVVVTHGDVVACKDKREFGILSGDDLVLRLSKELPDVTRLVFAMGGVEGVLESMPIDDQPGVLIEALTKNAMFEDEHMSEMDVTGGIGLKVQRGFAALESGVEVLLVSGEEPQRVADACLGNPVRGTRLVA